MCVCVTLRYGADVGDPGATLGFEKDLSVKRSGLCSP